MNRFQTTADMIAKACLAALMGTSLTLGGLSVANAQNATSAPMTDEEIEDVIIVLGTKSTSGPKAMAAFNRGDFATAEIEFERHFDALQRTERATKRAARIGADANQTAILTAGLTQVGSGGGGGNGPGAQDVTVVNSASASNAATQTDTLRNASKSNGRVSYEDFAFAEYMTALSEIQLGKLDEAKESLRRSVKHNYRNYDAQMRLGLLELRDGEVLEARERLIRLDKMRKRCGSCEDKAEISEAAVTLANALTGASRRAQ